MRRIILICFCIFLLSCNNISTKDSSKPPITALPPTDTNSTNNKPLAVALKMTATNLTGRQYSMQNQEYLNMPYDRKYSNKGAVFTTTYLTYNPNSGNAIHRITVVYDTLSQKIKIKVKAVFGGVFTPDDLNYKLKVTPEFKTLQPWGQEGIYRKFAGTGTPHEILVQFATENFNYLNLLEVKSEDDGDGRYWYLLDQPIQTATSNE
jgi:hypothetical protein